MMKHTATILRHLPFFIAVGKAENFRRAAAELNIAQPALSRRISALEREMGVLLFERLPQGVRLTEAGRLFLADIEQVVDQVERAWVHARTASAGQTGSLRIGFAPSATRNSGLQRVWKALQDLKPDVAFNFLPMKSADQFQLLREGKIDLGIVYHPHMPDMDDLSSCELMKDELLLAMPRSHPLAQRRRLSVKDIEQEGFIVLLRSTGPSYYDYLLETCAAAGLRLRITHEVTDREMMLSLMSLGMGICFIHNGAVSPHMKDIALRRVSDLHLSMPMVLIWRKDSHSALIEDIVQVFRSVLAPAAPTQSSLTEPK